MKMNALILTLIACFFLAVIVLAQTAPSELMNNTTQQPGDNQTKVPNLSSVVIPHAPYVEGDLLVRFNSSAFPNNESMEAASMQANAAIGAVMITDYSSQGINGLELVRLPPGMTTQQGIAYYQSIPSVMYAEVNAVYSIANAPNQTSNTTTFPPSAGNTTTAGGLFVRYNQTAFPSTHDMQVYANTTNAAIHASVITDYTAYGLPGLQLISLQPNTTVEQGIAYYRNTTYVLYAEPNTQYHALSNGTNQNTTQKG